MVSRTSVENWDPRHGGAVEPHQPKFEYELHGRNPAPPAFGHDWAGDDADSLSRRVLYVAALTGLVALWLCGG